MNKQLLICTLLMSLAASSLSARSEAGKIHAAITPLEAGFLEGRWQSFYATIINDSPVIARRCRIETAADDGYEIRFVTTEQKHNRPIGDLNEPADIFPRSKQSFRIDLRLVEGATEQEQAPRLGYMCDGLQPAKVLPGVNQVTLGAKPVAIIGTVPPQAMSFQLPEAADSVAEVVSRFGCVAKNDTYQVSHSFCTDDRPPASLAVSTWRRSNLYHFCYEGAGGEIESLYMIVERSDQVSAHKCTLHDPSLGCSVSLGRFPLRLGSDFAGGKGGYFCEFPPSPVRVASRIEIENSFREQGSIWSRGDICDDTSCDWSKLDWSSLKELTGAGTP